MLHWGYQIYLPRPPNFHEYSINQISRNFHPTWGWLNGLIRKMKMVGNGDEETFLSILLSRRFVPILSFDFKKTGFSRDGYLCSGKRFGANVKHFLMNGSGKKVFVDTSFLSGRCIRRAGVEIGIWSKLFPKNWLFSPTQLIFKSFLTKSCDVRLEFIPASPTAPTSPCGVGFRSFFCKQSTFSLDGRQNTSSEDVPTEHYN